MWLSWAIFLAALLKIEAAQVLLLDDTLQPCSRNGHRVATRDGGGVYDVCIINPDSSSNPRCTTTLYLKQFEWRSNLLPQLTSLVDIRTNLLVQCE